MSELNCNGNHNCEFIDKDSVITDEVHSADFIKHNSTNSVSISPSVIHNTGIGVQQKPPLFLSRVMSKEKTIIFQKIYLPTILVILLILVVAMFQIPTVLYYTDPPSPDDYPLDGVNLESCTVSWCVHMWHMHVVCMYVIVYIYREKNTKNVTVLKQSPMNSVILKLRSMCTKYLSGPRF